ncbi:DUF2187 domain-containing protein [Schleiferilactobacillus shenzhenensis]|uniref:DUF2187 domain-containing protein n=1 Tax=Schleiferilactobacillus shenzhenensis LY-73 TaxID=1231336 RepID=U4THE2_9LACO|nr:DUF2187 domain-containing protein [Schleiferilactobacillus shenzhenensis]ERL64226.1 hypothetical protein L248_1504 [Schleiferilactobacillus shenzhenensis LY-73]
MATANEVAVGDKVTVRKSADVPMSFKGTVMKVYTNSALVSIDSYQETDQNIVSDLKDKTIINFKHIRVTKNAAKPAKKAADTEKSETAAKKPAAKTSKHSSAKKN